MPYKFTIEDMQILAGEKNGKCLSKKFLGTKEKLEWQCSEGHIFWKIPNSVITGTWCRECGNKIGADKIRKTIEEMHEVAKSRKGRCLSDKYITTDTKLKWQCEKGHEWMATPHTVKRGSWCPTCGHIKIGDLKRKTIEEMQEIAKGKNGICLSKKYVNSKNKLQWRCKEGHIFWRKPNDVQQGHWCPICAKTEKKYKKFPHKHKF